MSLKDIKILWPEVCDISKIVEAAESDLSDQNIKVMLIESYNFLIKTGEGEGPLDTIYEVLDEYPQYVDIFLDLFKNEQNKLNRETLAQIIIYVVPFEPALDYLKTDMNWVESDFEGYPGYEQ